MNERTWWDAWTGNPKWVRQARDKARVRVAGQRIDAMLDALLRPVLDRLDSAIESVRRSK